MIRGGLAVLLAASSLAALVCYPFRESIVRHWHSEWFETNVIMGRLVRQCDRFGLGPFGEPTDSVARMFEFVIPFEDDLDAVLDGWGQPIWLNFVDDHPDRGRFVSFGANGRDENGEGDDATVVFNTEPLEVVWSPVLRGYPGGLLRHGPLWLAVALALAVYPTVNAFRSAQQSKRAAWWVLVLCSSFLALAAACGWSVSYVTTLEYDSRGGLYGMGGLLAKVDSGVLNLSYMPAPIREVNCLPSCARGQDCRPSLPTEITKASLMFVGLQFRVMVYPDDCDYNQITRLRLPLWLPSIAFTPIPVLAFIRGPLRRRRRRKKGFCVKCGYNLRGNVSGICPECGSPCGPDEAQAAESQGPERNT